MFGQGEQKLGKNIYENEAFARFVITSETIKPNQITEILKKKPDKSWEINTPKYPNTTITHKYNLWEIFIKAHNIYHTDVLLEELFTVLLPMKNDIALLDNEDVEKEISIVIYKKKANFPSISYNPKIISFLNDLNVTLDIDLYDLE